VVIVAEEAGMPGVVGFAQVRDEGDRAWLEDLWVDADRLRSGVGRLLWDAALAIAHEMGRSVLELESDPNAEPFYERMGAHRIGVRPSSIEDGRRLPLMRITLDAPTA
jgi:ribosomal protein S18 acetylase RimI-like enzyme